MSVLQYKAHLKTDASIIKLICLMLYIKNAMVYIAATLTSQWPYNLVN